MAFKMVRVALAMVVIVSICGGTMAQSGCTSALMGMSPCLNFITGNISTPSSSCCSQLGNLVQSQPQCLCSVLNGNGINLGISINRTLALALPGACNVQTPPVSQCNASNGPGTSSTPSPSSSPEGSTNEPDILPESPTESDSPSVMVMVMLCDGTTVESSKCRSALVSLSPCLNYVSGNSSTPSHPCCSQLANVVRSEPRCLCVLVDGGNSATSLNINETLALGLPDVCNVHTPPVSRCDGNGTQSVPATSGGTTISLPFYFNFVLLLLASNLYG
ncbi:hypothetical protein LXL04_001034 [Taraxacum kok-saghyz]